MTSSPTPTDLQAILKNCSKASVLCIGDVMLDRFIYGKVERISPEAPVPVFALERTLSMLGGSANAAANITSLQANAILLAVIGDDAEGVELCSHVYQKLNHSSHLLEEAHRKTSVKQRYISGIQQLLRVDNETSSPISARSEDLLIENFNRLLPTIDAVMLSDYGKGILTSRILSHVISSARKADKFVVVDPKGRDFSIYAGANAITPNRKELHDATGMETETDEDIEKAARHIISSCNIDAVVATRGPKGIAVVTKDNAVFVPTFAREVWDVSGAGDTVIATIATAVAIGADLVTAAHLANHAAGIVVGKIGTAVASVDEIHNALLNTEHKSMRSSKFTSLAHAVEIVERWRSKGASIGFTNGVFDLLHPGHISSLRQARAACDRLVVALNSDDSVKRLKGEGRPVQSLDKRAAMLAALEDVDLVISFANDTPIELIKAIKPDVLIKGGDYKEKDVVGADIVKANGGRIVLANIEQGFSTTSLIEKLRSAS